MIKRLSQEVIAHIAAGQVIERPASVLKELIDNAIDAQSTNIHIKLKKGGIDGVSVYDDGVGIQKEDLHKALEPHTTSKIVSIEDMFSITTHGFRGEALHSIVQCADVHIESRVRGEEDGAVSGWSIDVRNGVLSELKPVGMSPGTRIDVGPIFSRMPARRKRLTQNQKEFQACMKVIRAYGLFYPEVSFTLVHNDKEILHVPATEDHTYRLEHILSADYLKDSHYFETSFGDVTMYGYLGKPHVARRNAHHQYISINKRPILNPDIHEIIRKTYNQYLDPHAQPMYIIGITYPQERVDINIDPHKDFVGITDQDVLHEYLETYIQKELDSALSYVNVYDSEPMDYFTASLLRDRHEAWSVFDTSDILNPIQIFKTYIVIQSKSDLVLIDQHAAHERILYDQFLKAYSEEHSKGETYTLKKPVAYHVEPEYIEVLRSEKENLTKIGFSYELLTKPPTGSFESFSRNPNVLIHAIPLLFSQRSPLDAIHDALEEIETHDVDSKSHKTITYVACRSAVKAGDVLTKKQMLEIIKKLQTCTYPQTCPHGRPTTHRISQDSVEKFFNRR